MSYGTPIKDLCTDTISINIKNQSLLTVFSEIEAISSYQFFYKNDDIDLDQKITINVQNTTIKSLLIKLFYGRAIKHRIKGNKILLKEDKNLYYSVKGIILDKQTGIPVEDVHLISNDKKTRVLRNAEGVFDITFNKLPIHLTISHINYGNHKIEINELSDFTINLPSLINHLDAVTLITKDKQERLNKIERLLKDAKVISGSPVFVIKPGKNSQFSKVDYHWDKKKKEFTILTQAERKQ